MPFFTISPRSVRMQVAVILKPWIFDEFLKHDTFECTVIEQTTAQVPRLVCEEFSPNRHDILTITIIWSFANSFFLKFIVEEILTGKVNK